ncbi:uncharacterized protein LOC121792000 [Salvia splendens]|uniref:uncharacterized protein LOC121792000 n=1 Tax=Salvia splendens TaxID=180675 RepID=UPI001C254A80|nr:uncharacterized protein LOC121792000 [Salvia splendens]
MSTNEQAGSQWGMPSAFNPPEPGTSKQQSGVGRKESLVLNRIPDSSDALESPEVRRNQPIDPVNAKLDRLLVGVSHLESRIDATERRVVNLDSTHTPEPDPHYDIQEYDDGDFDHHRSNLSFHRGSKHYSHAETIHNTRSTYPTRRFPEIPLPRPPHDPGYSAGHRIRSDRPPRQFHSQSNQFPDFSADQFRPRNVWEPPQNRNNYSRTWDNNHPRMQSCWDPPPNRHQSGFQNSGFQNSDYFPRVKMDPPHFDGSDASNWISRVQYYFDHIMMPEDHRLHYTVMLFDPPVDDWIFNYRANNHFVTWLDFLEDVRHRFDPQCYENYIGLISKLCQTDSVSEYQLAFEKMMNRISGVPESTLLPIYITGLKQPIQRQVKLHRPSTLASAFALSQELSATHAESNAPTTTGFHKRPWAQKDSRGQTTRPLLSSDKNITTTSAVGQPSSARSRDFSKLPVVRVSNAEKAERSRRGQCWYCNDKWAPGHVCNQTFLVYMGIDEDEEQVTDQDEDIVTADLSHLQSRDGRKRAKSLTIVGTIGSLEVSILIDTGASHDFLHPRVAEKLQLPLSPITPFRVYVGSGEYLLCTHVSKKTTVLMQGTSFVLDLHVLAAYGSDLILGMEWLESLGKVTHDYPERTMEFIKDGTPVLLRGITPNPRPVSICMLSAMLSRTTGHDLYELVAVDPSDRDLNADQPLSLPTDLPPTILATLQHHIQVFSTPSGMPPRRLFDHKIHLQPNSRPVNVRPYRYPYFQKNEIERQVREMLDQGIIQRSQSPFSSPVLLIRKKDGSFRFCIDYRALNTATVPDHFPIPTTNELFDELGSAKYFTKLDLRSGYHQIRMQEEDVFKTAFRTHDGHFEFLVMPFGLTNAPSTFQAAMNTIFQPLLRKSVIVFFDDILIYSASLDLHASHLAEVLSILQANQFFVKLSKCSFCSTSVEYLGHIITDGQLKADSCKIDAMVAWPIPSTIKQLKGFLGLTGYYRRFIANYALIAAPLTDLLKKDSFVWSPAAEQSFCELKTAMTSAPVLRLPDFSRQFCVETDACDFGVGAVLLQDNHPLAFFSKKLGPRRRVASTYHKELYAIVEAVQKWRQYLLGREFIIRTDQKSLKELLQQVVQTPDQHLYVRKLMGYKFVIEYKKGSNNKVADALSRRDEPTDNSSSVDAALLAAASQPVPSILADLKSDTAASAELQDLILQISAGLASPHFTFDGELVYFKRRIFVPAESNTKRVLLHEHHSTPSAGHPGWTARLDA